MEKMNEGKMYEVLKFVEHGEYCRQSMDCVHGMLLIDCMREEGRIDKAVLFAWFQQIAVCADQYERSGTGKNYKYYDMDKVIAAALEQFEKIMQTAE